MIRYLRERKTELMLVRHRDHQTSRAGKKKKQRNFEGRPPSVGGHEVPKDGRSERLHE